MFGELEWLDGRLYPKLVLDGESIEVAYQPVAVDHGPAPLLSTFKVQCIVRHSAGSLIYTADDLTMMPSAFAAFASDLKEVLDGSAQEATLAPVGRELVVTMRRMHKYVQMYVAVMEWQGPHDPETVMSAGCARLNTDRTYRWVRELSEYGRQLDEWVLANPAT